MKIFVDASYTPTKSHAGFYKESNNQMMSIPINAKTSVRAETLACLLALRYNKNKNMILTDCKPAYDFIMTKYPFFCDNLQWVSRKKNKIADKLSKMYELSDDKTPKKMLDYRGYILNSDEAKKIALYRNLATEDWQLDFVKAMEVQYKEVKKNPLVKFKYKGKFHSNGDWISLIWMTNEHKLIGRGFFNYMKTRGQHMERQLRSKEFLELLNKLKQKRIEYGRKRINRPTNGKTIS